jgi:hypothetical protein
MPTECSAAAYGGCHDQTRPTRRLSHMGQCLSVGVADWVASRPQRHDFACAAPFAVLPIGFPAPIMGSKTARNALFIGITLRIKPGVRCTIDIDSFVLGAEIDRRTEIVIDVSDTLDLIIHW